MNKKEKSLLVALVVGVGVAAVKYFTSNKENKTKGIRELFYEKKYKTIVDTFKIEQIEKEIYDIYKEEMDVFVKFRAILFLTMLQNIPNLQKYNDIAQVLLEECVKEETKKNFGNIRVENNKIRVESFYDLIEPTDKVTNINAAIKFGIDECLKGNYKKGKEIFLSNTMDNSDEGLISLLICFFQDEFFNSENGITQKHFKKVLKSEKYLFVKSKVLDKYGMYKEQKELLEDAYDEKQSEQFKNVFIHHMLINMIKRNEKEEKIVGVIEKWLENKHELTNTVINVLGVIFEYGMMVEQKELVEKVFDEYITDDVDSYTDCRMHIFNYLINPFLNKNIDKVEILRKGMEMDEKYYKLYVFLSGETKDVELYKKALRICTTKADYANTMRILLVCDVQNEVLNNNQ